MNNVNITRGTYIMSMDARFLYSENNQKNPCSKCKGKKECNDENQSKCEKYSKYEYNLKNGYDARKYDNSVPIETEKKGKGRPVKQQFKINKKIYGVSIPYSLALKELFTRWENEFLIDDFGKVYTKMIINVKFKGLPKERVDEYEYSVDNIKNKFIDSKDASIAEIQKLNGIETDVKTFDKTAIKRHVLKPDDEIKTTKQLRYKIYDEGFKIDGVPYVRLMRSSSKSRGGSCLFIKEAYYNEFISWARLQLNFDLIKEGDKVDKTDSIDLASLFGYESLVLSSIVDTLFIEKDEILLISDYESKFKDMAIVTEMVKEEINGQNVNHAKASSKEYNFKNSLFDGSCLLDTSKFTEKKGVKLLRQRMFKGAAFHSFIQRFLSDQLTDEEKERGTIPDMFGRPVKIDRIKLICTPSSVKFLKFSFKCVCDHAYKTYEKEIEEYKELVTKDEDETTKARIKELNQLFMKFAYEFWLDNLNGEFGIVKSEKGEADDARRMSYQQLMSLPLNRDETKELMQHEFGFVQKLKDDTDYMLWFIGNYKSSNKDFITNLLVRNKLIADTVMYRDFRDNIIDNYRDNRLRMGKIKIPHSDYAVCIANPITYLYHAIGRDISEPKEFNKYDENNKVRECYCSSYEPEEDLFCIRNPIIYAGNVCCLKNKYNEDFDRYLYLTDNILVVNCYDNTFMDKNNGEDFDIDCNYLSNYPLLVEKAKYCEEHFLTPVNDIKPIPSSKYYSLDDMVETDNQISQGKVGDIVNSSAILNGYYWDTYYNEEMTKEKKEEVLNYLVGEISRYASLSNTEIDRAKREFEVKTSYELKKMGQMQYLTKANIKVPIKKLKIKEAPKTKGLTVEEIKVNEKVQSCQNLVDELNKFNQELVATINNEEITEEEKQKKLEDHSEKTNPIKDELNDKINELARIKEGTIVRQYFWKWCGRGQEYKFEKMNCPMDHLEDIIDNEFPRKSNTDNKGQTIPLKQLFKNPEEDLSKANRDQITEIVDIVTEMDKIIRGNQANKKKKKTEDIIDNDTIFRDTVEIIAEMKIKPITIKAMFYRIYCNPNCNKPEALEAYKKIHEIRTRLIEVLYAAHPEEVLSIFDYDTNYKVLDVFGKKYIKKVSFEKSII